MSQDCPHLSIRRDGLTWACEACGLAVGHGCPGEGAAQLEAALERGRRAALASIPSTSLTLEVCNGATIQETCREAQRVADLLRVSVRFVFSDLPCVVRPGGDCSETLKRFYE